MSPESHIYKSSDGLYCDTCNLPATNQVHLQWNLENAEKLLSTRAKELGQAEDNYDAVLALVARLRHQG